MKREEGLQRARQLKQRLIQKGFPVHQVFLYGSVARGEAKPDSDIDIAVVCSPFALSRVAENAEFLWASKDIDLRIETVCLHQDDLQNRYSSLVQAVKNEGIAVE